MDLAEFVKQSLTQIVKGVEASQLELKNSGGYVNPAVTGGGPSGGTMFGVMPNGQPAMLVDFDVAVTASETQKGGIGGQLSVVTIFRLEAGGNANTSNESTSRIKFKIPLALPLDATTKQELDARHREQQSMINAHNRY